jgi:hypothetical protein
MVEVPVRKDNVTDIEDLFSHPAGIFEKCTGITEVEENLAAPGLNKGRKSWFCKKIAVDVGGIVDEDP